MSSGSSAVASAVEPTRSLNKTVTCRRSASDVGAALGGVAGASGHRLPLTLTGAPCREAIALTKLSPMTEGNSELLEILLGQIGKNVEVDVVGGQNADQLLQAELREPL